MTQKLINYNNFFDNFCTITICGLTLAGKQIGCSRAVDKGSDHSDWERSAFDALNEMDE